jgi:uncharacterized membrane protein YoaK (UPF0700 family)
MISKLPRWVWLGGWLLAFLAGMINGVGLLGFEHQAVTHLTGTTSMLASAVAEGSRADIWHFACVLGSFVIGCVISGVIVQDGALRLDRPYGFALLLESALLGISVPLMDHQLAWGHYAASCACGLQNAMVTTFSGAVVRTCHLSGMFTDLGMFLGHAMRGLKPDWRRLALCVMVISGFFTGGVAGALGFQQIGHKTLFVPAVVTAVMALGFKLWQLAQRRRRVR